MRLQSWRVLTLPPVECYPAKPASVALQLRHLGTVVQPEALEDGRRIGDTVWGASLTGQLLAVSWDWIEILPGVVCLVDPANVLTNIRFVNALNHYEEPARTLVLINELIHQTPWQAIVCATLDASASASPTHLDRRQRPALDEAAAARRARDRLQQGVIIGG